MREGRFEDDEMVVASKSRACPARTLQESDHNTFFILESECSSVRAKLNLHM